MICLLALAAVHAPPPYAMHTGGMTDGVVVPYTEVLNSPKDLTLEAWIKPESADVGGPFHFIVSKNYEGRGYAMVLIGRGDSVRIQFEANETIAYHVPLSVLKQQWWHIAGVFHSGKRITLYVNGVVAADKETAAMIDPNTRRPLSIGTSPWDGFTGMIGDVRVWTVARTQEEIVRDMGRRLTGTEPGLLAEWDFRHRSGKQVFDLTHHTKPGVMQGLARIVRTASSPARRPKRYQSL